MAEIMEGSIAVSWGAVEAGLEAYCSYPVTPQNEIIEFMSRELEPRGKAFRQSTSEVESTFLTMGFASAGARTMTSTASPGWGLYPEGVSHITAAELPVVIAMIMRGGPGQGTTRHSQMDYNSVTRPAGQGPYRNICLAPNTVQECYDLIQLAFVLAEKYRNPVFFVSEPNVTRMLELMERRPAGIPAPTREWGVQGKGTNNGVARLITSGHGRTATPEYPNYLDYLKHLDQKNKEMAANEVRYDEYDVEDADIVIVAYGYTSRVSRESMRRAREKGIKVGLIRPITLWPFPSEPVRRAAERGSKILVVEDSNGKVGGLVDDVRLAAAGLTEIFMCTALDRHETGENGSIFPGEVVKHIEAIQKGLGAK